MRIFPSVAITALFLAVSTLGQTPRKGIDDYMDSGKTIFIAKCIRVGPVNKLLRADVDLEVIHLVKGLKLPSSFSVYSQFAMVPGKTYLIRSEDEYKENGGRLGVLSRDSVIQIQDYENLSELVSLQPRIIVLRTMNTRIRYLENKLALLNFEIESLRAARIE